MKKIPIILIIILLASCGNENSSPVVDNKNQTDYESTNDDMIDLDETKKKEMILYRKKMIALIDNIEVEPERDNLEEEKDIVNEKIATLSTKEEIDQTVKDFKAKIFIPIRGTESVQYYIDHSELDDKTLNELGDLTYVDIEKNRVGDYWPVALENNKEGRDIVITRINVLIELDKTIRMGDEQKQQFREKIDKAKTPQEFRDIQEKITNEEDKLTKLEREDKNEQ